MFTVLACKNFVKGHCRVDGREFNTRGDNSAFRYDWFTSKDCCVAGNTIRAGCKNRVVHGTEQKANTPDL